MTPSATHLKIALIGAGNVATHFGRALRAAEVDVCCVVSRTFQHAARLATELDAVPLQSAAEIPTDVNYVIISTSDTAVAAAAEALPAVEGVVVHTSGSIELETLAKFHAKCGVLYPLQTFSRDTPVDVSQVPFFTEGSDEDVLAQIDALARLLSPLVYHADSEKRKSLHIAGVLTSNFPIYMLQMAQKTLADAGCPLDVVKPLVQATIEKAFAIGPDLALTGPARRGDRAVVKLHESCLSSEDAEIYHIISKAIINKYHREQD